MSLFSVKTLASIVALAPLTLMSINQAVASSYVVSPAARAALCKTGENINCGDFAKFQPQLIASETTLSGFPQTHIASGGLDRYQNLNTEGAERWHKTAVASGKFDISWQIVSPTKFAGWKYYITRADWQQTLDNKQQLTAASFEAKPFCEVAGDTAKVQQGLVTHHCQLPARHGYQLIYAIANDADGESVYNIIDVNVGKSAEHSSLADMTSWRKEIATIDTPLKVKAGDVIHARFFGADEERNLETRVTIKAGEEQRWSAVLAEAINAEHSDIRAGVRDNAGDVAPSQNKINSIYVNEDSYLTGAVISVN